MSLVSFALLMVVSVCGASPLVQTGTWRPDSSTDGCAWPDKRCIAVKRMIQFPHAFAGTPTVVVQLAGLDVFDSNRIFLEVTKTNPIGFELYVNIWGNTPLWGYKISWIAFDAALAEENNFVSKANYNLLDQKIDSAIKKTETIPDVAEMDLKKVVEIQHLIILVMVTLQLITYLPVTERNKIIMQIVGGIIVVLIPQTRHILSKLIPL
jgi:hypothetical protein